MSVAGLPLTQEVRRNPGRDINDEGWGHAELETVMPSPLTETVSFGLS